MSSDTHWHYIERHPLSAEYEDLEDSLFEEMCATLLEFGVLPGRKVIIWEDMVIDGWQLQRACVAVNVKPPYLELQLPKGFTPESYVHTMNDVRRHETEQMIERRIRERQARIAERRRQGQSTRTIADAEKVSQTQVREDLKTSTEQGCSVDPPEGKVTGQDGKQRDANKPPKPQKLIYCADCAFFGAEKDCPKCKEAREKAKEKAKTETFSPKSWDFHYGGLISEIDRMSAYYGQPFRNPRKAGLERILEELLQAFQAWHKELKKGKKS